MVFNGEKDSLDSLLLTVI